MQIRVVILLMSVTLGLAPAWAATRVQSRLIGGGGGDDSLPLAYTSSLSAGAHLVAICAAFQGTYSAADATFSDSQTNTWVTAINIGPGDGGVGNEQVRLWIGYATSAAGGANTVTCDPPGTSNYITLVIIEYSGVTTPSPLDQTASDNDENGNTTPLSGTTLATTIANEVIVAGVATGAPYTITSITETSPCTLVQEVETWDTDQPIAVCDYVVSTIGTQSTSWTLDATQTWAAGIVTFKASAPPVGGARRGIAVVFP